MTLAELQELMPKGSLVICECHYPAKDEYGNDCPQHGMVYTIRDYVEEPSLPDILGIFLNEIHNKPLPTRPDGRLLERAFLASFFRPVSRKDLN